MDTICKKCTDTDMDSSLWIRIRYGFKKLISAHSESGLLFTLRFWAYNHVFECAGTIIL